MATTLTNMIQNVTNVSLVVARGEGFTLTKADDLTGSFVEEDKTNIGGFEQIQWDDATWILTSAFIIFTMQSGFGLLESGSVSDKNEVNIMIKNAVDVLFGGLSYWMVGFGFSVWVEGKSNQFMGLTNFFLDSDKGGGEDGHVFALFFFQTSFATTATTIVSGSMAERTKLEAYIIFSIFNTLVYCFPSHWMWRTEKSWFYELGVLDIAGASTVHLVGGVTGLVATIMLGPRTGRFDSDEKGLVSQMGSPTNAVLGLFMLWWGWLGFNCGSTYGIANNKWVLATRSAVATILASVGGGITAIALSYFTKKRKFDVAYIINGILGALVSITAYCALAKPWESLVMGSIGGCLACLSIPVIEKLKIDDPVGVVPVHLVAAVWGMLAVGFFGETDELENLLKYNGLLKGGGFRLLGVQLLVVVVVGAWAAILSFIILKVIDLTIGLRVPLHEELLGADLVEHSVNGSYIKETHEWLDVRGNVIMAINKSNKESYRRSIARLKAILNEEEEAVDGGSSTFGFKRSSRRSRRGRRNRQETSDVAPENDAVISNHNTMESNGRSNVDMSVSYSVQLGMTNTVDSNPDVVAQPPKFVEIIG